MPCPAARCRCGATNAPCRSGNWVRKSRFEAILALDTAEFGDLLYPLYEHRCGQVVVSADEILTVAIATEMQSRLLRLEASAPLIVIERLAFDLERRPIERRGSRGPADRFRYHAERFLDELISDDDERARVLASPRELFRF